MVSRSQSKRSYPETILQVKKETAHLNMHQFYYVKPFNHAHLGIKMSHFVPMVGTQILPGESDCKPYLLMWNLSQPFGKAACKIREGVIAHFWWIPTFFCTSIPDATF